MSNSKTSHNILLPDKIKNSLPSMVKNELSKLPAQKQEEFIEEYNRKSKSVAITYLFFIFGLHYIYLSNVGLQILYWVTGGGFLIWFFIDIFRIPLIVENYNRDIAIDVLRNLKSVSI